MTSVFTLTIETDNAAFEDDNLAPEIARILRKLAVTVERELTPDSDDGFSVRLQDVNGNKVGECNHYGS